MSAIDGDDEPQTWADRFLDFTWERALPVIITLIIVISLVAMVDQIARGVHS